MMRTVFAVTVLAAGIGPPALADGIRVSPHEARPGQRVHITVPDCGVGPTRHTATSAAFAHLTTLHGKADTGEADATIKPGLAPGPYPVTAFCGRHTELGQVVIAGHPPSPATSPEGHGSSWTLAAILALLAGGGVLLVARRRRR